jgi:tetratricopeptide (TPR) repeat protein
MGRNLRLAGLIDRTGLSYDAIARDLRAVARENGQDMSACGRSHVAHWVAGTHPSRATPLLLAEVLSRRLGRVVTLDDIGLGREEPEPYAGLINWAGSSLTDLLGVGRADVQRRDFATRVLYSLGALAVPADRWREIAGRGRAASGGGATIGRADVAAVREMLDLFSRADERLGGGHARLAVVEYLTTDVAGYLTGRFTSTAVRRDMFTGAAELAFTAGWKTFDTAAHGLAERYYLTSLRLAAEADNPALGAYVLRALAHQAADLGHGQQCVDLSDAALQLSRSSATPAALALFTVLRARGLALTGAATQAIAALRGAEHLLGKADQDSEPSWLRNIGFGEAVLASQTGQTLRDLGDHAGAERAFRSSVQLRDGTAYRRVHALTLANLAETQARLGRVDLAAATWHTSLDHMTGIRSHRAHQAVDTMRRWLRALGPRLPAEARLLADRVSAEDHLTT